MKAILALSAALSLAGLSANAAADAPAGAGATFPYPIYAKWLAAYQAQTGIAISYQPAGSGLGITLIRQKAVTFGASDMPLKPALLDQYGLIQFPTVVGGDVPVVNLPGIRPDALVLDGPTLANIYLGRITNWTDPAIRKLNPNLALPSMAISVVHRSDGSGTTFIWADYLSKQSVEWRQKVGASTSVTWPVASGAGGNKGVAEAVADLKGGIGYVEYSYALKNRLSYARVVNRAGKAVSPSLDSFRAAAAGADWATAPGFYLVLTDLSGEKSWPIAGATFILMPKQPTDPAATRQALDFFKWAYDKGGDMALGLNYVPLPADAVHQVEASWRQLRN
jgi:phosphate transport system substrate-binding protein